MNKAIDKYQLSLVVPVYNSADSLDELIQRIGSTLPDDRFSKELILVNDGSADNSWQKILELAKKYPWIQGINLTRNFGQHNALAVGFNRTKYPIIITLDDDLQHPPEEIPKLLEKLSDDVDVVYGVPEKANHDKIKRFGSYFTKWMIRKTMGGKNAESVSAFRVFRSSLLPVFSQYRGDYINVDALLCWCTTRFASVSVQHDARKHGQSNYTFGKNLTHAINMITGFSVIPLQIASILGFLLVIIGCVIFLYVLWNYFTTASTVKGFAFTVATISLFAGVQMFCLGIIGAYLARIHLRSSGKPIALIRETTLETTNDN